MKHYRIIAGNSAPISKTSEGDIITLVTSMLLFYFLQLLFYTQLAIKNFFTMKKCDKLIQEIV